MVGFPLWMDEKVGIQRGVYAAASFTADVSCAVLHWGTIVLSKQPQQAIPGSGPVSAWGGRLLIRARLLMASRIIFNETFIGCPLCVCRTCHRQGEGHPLNM